MTNINREMEWNLNAALSSFCVRRNKHGFPYTKKAMKLLCEDENRMLNLSRDIYEVIAADQSLDASGVTSAIRRVAKKAWKHNQTLLLAYNPSLVSWPSNSEFFEILLHFLEDPGRGKYLAPRKRKPVRKGVALKGVQP